MAGATINLSKSSSSGSYIIGKIVWSSTVDNEANNSDVTASLYVRKDSHDMILTIPTEGTWTYSLTVNGSTITGTVQKSVLTDWVLVATKSVSNISHDTNGSKSITISGSVTGPTGTSLAGHTTSGSGTAKFDTVPRASTIDSISCTTNYFNGKITYKYTPQTSSYYNRCNISLNLSGTYIAVKSINLGKKAASQQTATVTLSSDELAIIYNKLPSTTKGVLRFTFRTYSNSDYSSQIGDAAYREITLYVPDITDTKPTVSMTLAPVSSLGTAFSSLYIQGKSKVKATLSATGKYSATIKSYKMIADGSTYDSADSYTSDYLGHAGSIKVYGYATDSRGITGQVSKTITVIPYSKPQILPVSGESEVIAARCNSSGTLSDSGTYLKIKAKRSYSTVMSTNGQYNYCKIRYRYKAEGGTYSGWTNILLGSNLTTNEITTGALLGGALAVDKTYIVQVQAIDDIGEYATTTITVPTDKVYMHKAASMNSIGIGKYAEEENTVDIADDINIYGRVYGLGKTRIALQEGDDINSFLNFGVYAVTSNAIAKTIVNIPIQSAGRLIVSSGNGSGKQSGTYTYILQEYITFNGYYHCYREAYTSDDANVWYFNNWEIRSSTFWKDLGLSDEVSASSSNMGRVTNGTCCYRVVNENHVYVAFNCAFAYNNAPITVSKNSIPSPYRPARNVYALCTLNGRNIARIFVNSSGAVRVDYVQNMASAENTTAVNVNWIDGYIDYWV